MYICRPVYFYDIILIYIDAHRRPTIAGALLKLNGTSFGECEIFDTGQIVCRRTLFRRTPVTKANCYHISRIIVYGRAIGGVIRESATSKAGIISKLSGRCYRARREH